MTDEATRLMSEMALRFFNNRCEVTHEKFKKRGFVIHHVIELDEGEVLRRHYPNGEKGRAAYLKALYPLVEEDEDLYFKMDGSNRDYKRRYALIKNGIHTKLDHVRNGVTRLEMEKRQRFCDLAMRTIHKKGKKAKVKKRHYHRN